MIETRKREHSRKPDEAYDLIEACSPGPYLEMFARYARPGWTGWGAEADEEVAPAGTPVPRLQVVQARTGFRHRPSPRSGHGRTLISFAVRVRPLDSAVITR